MPQSIAGYPIMNEFAKVSRWWKLGAESVLMLNLLLAFALNFKPIDFQNLIPRLHPC
jgi:hypothetical protein